VCLLKRKLREVEGFSFFDDWDGGGVNDEDCGQNPNRSPEEEKVIDEDVPCMGFSRDEGRAADSDGAKNGG